MNKEDNLRFRTPKKGITTYWYLSCLRDSIDVAELPCDPQSWNGATKLGLKKLQTQM